MLDMTKGPHMIGLAIWAAIIALGVLAWNRRDDIFRAIGLGPVRAPDGYEWEMWRSIQYNNEHFNVALVKIETREKVVIDSFYPDIYRTRFDRRSQIRQIQRKAISVVFGDGVPANLVRWAKGQR